MRPPPATCAASRALRQREVDNALLVQALFGYRPTASVHEQLQRYINGELSREKAFADLYRRRQQLENNINTH